MPIYVADVYRRCRYTWQMYIGDADIRGRCVDPPTWAVETSGKFKGYYKESRCFFVLLRFVVFVNSKGGACRPWCWILVLAYIVMA